MIGVFAVDELSVRVTGIFMQSFFKLISAIGLENIVTGFMIESMQPLSDIALSLTL